MRLVINLFALIGVLAVVSVGAMELGYWPDDVWRPRVKRVIAEIQMDSEPGSPNNVITGVCNSTTMWSPRSRTDVVEDIRFRGVHYSLKCKDARLADVLIFYIEDSNKWYIKTAPGSPCKFSDSDIPKNCTPSDH